MMFNISGARIRAIRERLFGETQQQFADRLKVSRVDRWERGERAPKNQALLKKFARWDLELKRRERREPPAS